MPRYIVESYLSRTRRGDLSSLATRARDADRALAEEGRDVAYLRSAFVPRQHTSSRHRAPLHQLRSSVVRSPTNHIPTNNVATIPNQLVAQHWPQTGHRPTFSVTTDRNRRSINTREIST